MMSSALFLLPSESSVTQVRLPGRLPGRLPQRLQRLTQNFGGNVFDIEPSASQSVANFMEAVNNKEIQQLNSSVLAFVANLNIRKNLN